MYTKLPLVVVVDVLASTVRRGEGSLTTWLEQGVCYSFAQLYQVTRNRLLLTWSGVFAIMVMVNPEDTTSCHKFV